MKKTGAELVCYALEQLGIKYTFGIPGVHNTEIYDALNASAKIEPVLVTHECNGAFMADAISRCSDSVGTLLVVPAAGLTHAASGIGEAFLDGIAMLVISGGVRSDGMAYQLHDIDQQAYMQNLCKAVFKIQHQHEIVETLYRAYNIACANEPGPVYVEIPVDIALFKGECPAPQTYVPVPRAMQSGADENIRKMASALINARQPAIFAGWGARHASAELQQLAEHLAAPVATTLQGLSVFPADHALHTGMGMGEYAVPAASHAFKNIDCLLAVATRFSEIATGSYGINVPENLLHIDINPAVFNANYPAHVSLAEDARIALRALLNEVKKQMPLARDMHNMAQTIARHKAAYQAEWLQHNSVDKVNPAVFFNVLRAELHREDVVVCDDGNHTFLTAELMPVYAPAAFISPTDFNAMGYCVPACLGVKLMHPAKRVAGIVGDGGFLMSCMELLTAAQRGLGIVICVFNDGELAQIAQAQQIPYNRKTCTQIKGLNIAGIAMATGCEYKKLNINAQCEEILAEAFALADQGRPVIVDVNIDYSKKTRFTQGVVKTNLKRFSAAEKIRFIARALSRRISG
ncbi:MAG: thiamine pyrophosphate-binding protein [Oceanospirillaceae bacterium]|nr:thiamine pyrophosphate-binding protein [Oceanospirillaceae bacterium]MCP5335192.1 thiamine pyrophosphate-binding protein [Oceanospirillaceae bacterium]